ncbi:MAG: MauE/DoxX family redox-associated membrane protein, partial [Actinomycetota bacterium]
LAGLPVPLPELRRQVPEWWRSAFSPGTAGFLYGLGLGVGFATHLRHGTLVAVAAAALSSGDPLLAAGAMAGFGLARSLAVTVALVARDRQSAESLTALLERLALRAGPRILNGATLVAMAVVAVLSAGSVDVGRPTPVAAVVVAAAFGWAAGAKVIGSRAWRRALAAYRLPASLEMFAAWAIPAAEAGVAVAILTGAVALGAGLALVLLLAFSIAIARARRSHGDRLPCGCFGGGGSWSAGALLARNAGLACLAAVVPASGGVVPRFPTIGAGDAVPALLAATGAGLAGVVITWTTRLYRRSGRTPA